MKVKSCPKCGSINFVKRGFYKTKNTKKQKYYCKDCKHKFQLKVVLPSWVNKAYDDYVFNDMILKNLSIKYSKFIPTLVKYFDILNEIETKEYVDDVDDVDNKKRPPMAVPISLLLDATFFKRKGKYR